MKTPNGSRTTVLAWQEIAPELTYTVGFPRRLVRDHTVSRTLNSLSKDTCSRLSLSKAPVTTVSGWLLWEDAVREGGREEKQEPGSVSECAKGTYVRGLGAVVGAGHTLWVSSCGRWAWPGQGGGAPHTGPGDSLGSQSALQRPPEGPRRAGEAVCQGSLRGLGLGTGQARGQSAESTSSLLCARLQPSIALLLKGEGAVSSEAVTWDLLETHTPRPSPDLLLQRHRVSGANPRPGANASPAWPGPSSSSAWTATGSPHISCGHRCSLSATVLPAALSGPCNGNDRLGWSSPNP